MSQARKMRLVSGLFARKAVNLWASRVAHKSNILLQFSWHSLAQSRSMRLIWFSSPEIWPFLNKIQQSGFGKRVLSLFLAWNAIDFREAKSRSTSKVMTMEVRSAIVTGLGSYQRCSSGFPTGSDPWCFGYDTINDIIFKKFLLVIGQVLCLIIL